jgi:hypothetical protein
MKLQKQRSREVKGKEYFRWTIVIPPDQVKELEWEEGAELEPMIKNGNLVIRNGSKQKLSKNPSG